MSTAQEIVQGALNTIGKGSELLSTDQSTLDEGLSVLQSLLDLLLEEDIILAKTVDGVTTTISPPTALSDELNEPLGARQYLKFYLAAHLVPVTRANIQDVNIPSAQQSYDSLATRYQVHTIPSKIPSTLLPLGQGGRRHNGAIFFSGQAIDKDAV
jgi:hypothetical protein